MGLLASDSDTSFLASPPPRARPGPKPRKKEQEVAAGAGSSGRGKRGRPKEARSPVHSGTDDGTLAPPAPKRGRIEEKENQEVTKEVIEAMEVKEAAAPPKPARRKPGRKPKIPAPSSPTPPTASLPPKKFFKSRQDSDSQENLEVQEIKKAPKESATPTKGRETDAFKEWLESKLSPSKPLLTPAKELPKEAPSSLLKSLGDAKEATKSLPRFEESPKDAANQLPCSEVPLQEAAKPSVESEAPPMEEANTLSSNEATPNEAPSPAPSTNGLVNNHQLEKERSRSRSNQRQEQEGEGSSDEEGGTPDKGDLSLSSVDERKEEREERRERKRLKKERRREERRKKKLLMRQEMGEGRSLHLPLIFLIIEFQ